MMQISTDSDSSMHTILHARKTQETILLARKSVHINTKFVKPCHFTTCLKSCVTLCKEMPYSHSPFCHV